MSKVILVCGGRDYNDEEYLFRVLHYVNDTVGIKRLVAGDAAGADALALKWAKLNNVDYPIEKGKPGYFADWKRQYKRAGPIRNQRMIDEEDHIDFVLAFPGGTGTDDMIHKANVANISQIYLKGRKDKNMVDKMLNNEERT